MNEGNKDKSINPDALPQEEAFQKKEVFQHKQPADTRKPLEKGTSNATRMDGLTPSDKTSNEEGLNEERSAGDAGAFEGLEDQSN